jgi:ankyrin repeat protein
VEISPNPLTLADVLQRINETMDDFASKPAKMPNDRGAFEDYPLHKVAIWGDIEAANVLLNNGADINAIGEDGDTPLHRAVAGGQLDMMQFLISRGADTTIPNRHGTPAGKM